MITEQIAVRLPSKTYLRLQELAKRTGRSATYSIQEAIEEHLDDLEDAYLGELALQQLRLGKDSTMSLEEE